MGRSLYNSDNIVALNVRDRNGKLIATYDVSGVGKPYDTTDVLVRGKEASKNTITATAQQLREIYEQEKARGNKPTLYTEKDLSKKHKKVQAKIQSLF